MPSEATLRAAAIAAFRRSIELREDAEVLAAQTRYATGVALAVLGIEELAKAIIWTVAAVLPDDRSRLSVRLDQHALKHYVAMLAEWSPIEAEDDHLTALERLAHTCHRLGDIGLARLTDPREPRRYFQDLKDLVERHSTESLILDHEWKNVALYVDIVNDRVVTPARADGETYRHFSVYLRFLHSTYSALPEALDDARAWEALLSELRRLTALDDSRGA
jgi:AbiV family abortive infection protein